MNTQCTLSLSLSFLSFSCYTYIIRVLICISLFSSLLPPPSLYFFLPFLSLQYLGKDPTDCSQDLSEDGEISEQLADTSATIELPPCELSKLEDVYSVITSSFSAPVPREELALVLERDNYIQKLLNLFKVCEDLDNYDGLHLLYNIFRTLFLLNKIPILSVMFLPSNIMSVIGVLEYDPAKTQPTPHRKYLEQTSKYKEVIPIGNSEIIEKIHLTYKMCYIQEVILPTPSLFEENMMSAFNSLVLFNKSDIVNSIQVSEWVHGGLLYLKTIEDFMV